MHVGNALSLALGAEASDKEQLTVVVLAMKKDGLVLPGRGAAGALACPERSRRDGRVLCRSGRHASASNRTRMPVSVAGTAHF